MRLFILLAALGAVCAAPRKPERIVGGEITSIERYPFMSGVLENTYWGTEQMCGGTLITNRAVVTAAHCVEYFSPSDLRVRLGSTYVSSGGQIHVPSRITMHPQYNYRLVLNDIAVIRLQNAVTLSNQIQVARIAGPQYNLPDNTRLDVIGWGATSFNGKPSEVLQHASVNVINQGLCAERYKNLPGSIPRVTPEMICTGILDVGGKDACQGDSGGPVVHGGNVLVGITSWGYQCAHPTYPGVNVRVSSYTDWIATNAVN
ncbi:trypsin, alkaline B-like [Danaus plexippus]|uniref:trypsin, alkaline B-like n=1 Tax=Danaus plexippus TaxID=13037 RepID=UPI002AB11894|nr:trypsin, alkaline B-like [Danaus plexippus]